MSAPRESSGVPGRSVARVGGLGVAGSQDGPVDRHHKLSPPRIRQPLVLVSAGCSGLEHRPSVALSFVDERPRDQEVPTLPWHAAFRFERDGSIGPSTRELDLGRMSWLRILRLVR